MTDGSQPGEQSLLTSLKPATIKLAHRLNEGDSFVRRWIERETAVVTVLSKPRQHYRDCNFCEGSHLAYVTFRAYNQDLEEEYDETLDSMANCQLV